MAAFNFSWSSEGMSQPSLAGVLDQLSVQLAEIERKFDNLGSQSIQNSYYQQQPLSTPNYYHPSWQDHPSQHCTTSYGPTHYGVDYPNNYAYSDSYHQDWGYHPDDAWSYTHQDQYYAPGQVYSSDFQFQPPPQQEHNLTSKELLRQFVEQAKAGMNRRGDSLQNLENQVQQLANAIMYPPQPSPQQEQSLTLKEILTNVMERLEMRDASLRSLENQVQQLANAIMNCPQDSSPSDTELDLIEDGEEHCMTDSLDGDLEFQEAVGGKLGWSIEEDEDVQDEDDHALGLNDDIQTLMVPPWPFSKQDQIVEEYYQVYQIEGKLDDLDEYKFGGGHQSIMHAMQTKEKMKRRHEKAIFAIEPD